MSKRKTATSETEASDGSHRVTVILVIVGVLFLGIILYVVTRPAPDVDVETTSTPARPARSPVRDAGVEATPLPKPAPSASGSSCGPGQVYVSGYYREGRYVRGYCRSR